MYAQGDEYYFMDNENYEQYMIKEDTLGNDRYFLKEGLEVKVLLYKGRPIGIDLPKAVELTVVETDPGIKGDTAAGGTKPAKLKQVMWYRCRFLYLKEMWLGLIQEQESMWKG